MLNGQPRPQHSMLNAFNAQPRPRPRYMDEIFKAAVVSTQSTPFANAGRTKHMGGRASAPYNLGYPLWARLRPYERVR